jgi:hypothetical protein
MFNFVEKLIVKNVVKRLLKKLPKLKDKSNELLNVYGESLIEKVFKAIEQVVADFGEKPKN